jgi:predicted GH43/DUF377 family glycosyl hydrolase
MPADTGQKMKSTVDISCEQTAVSTGMSGDDLGLILLGCRLHVKRVRCIPVRKNFFISSIIVWLALPVVAQVPAWGIGPFIRPAEINPIIVPSTNSLFECPMTKTSAEWEAGHTFNPAAVVKDGKVFVVYRAEDNSGAAMIGGHTSRLGLAESDDGLHFHRFAEPVVFPAEDGQKANEWPGGCEDPRLVEGEDGTFILLYTQWNRKMPRLAEAGPPAVLTDRGIILLYNGKNDPNSGDGSLPPNVYSDGQALFDAKDPTHLLERTEHPFFKPEMAFERTGQYGGGTTFIEGLVWFHNKWFLYYGCADSFVGVAESGN